MTYRPPYARMKQIKAQSPKIIPSQEAETPVEVPRSVAPVAPEPASIDEALFGLEEEWEVTEMPITPPAKERTLVEALRDAEDERVIALMEAETAPLVQRISEDERFLNVLRSVVEAGELPNGLKELPAESEGPSLEMKRSELDELARQAGVQKPEKLPNKQAVLEAIEAMKAI